MVTKRYTINNVTYIEYGNGHRVIAADHYGNSSDEKPTECVHNGEFFFELDTGKMFAYDETAKSWNEM